jgi:hypothetical protein
MKPSQSDLPETNLKYTLGNDWEVVRKPDEVVPIEWCWNSYKPLFGKYLFRWRRGDFDWAPVPGAEPQLMPMDKAVHTFCGRFTVSETQRRDLKLGKFLKQEKKQNGYCVTGGKDYQWQATVGESGNVAYTLEGPEQDKWEYIAIPVVLRFLLSWGWKHEVRDAWYRELIPMMINLLFTRHGGGARISSVSFSDEPIYMKADYMIFRRLRKTGQQQETE